MARALNKLTARTVATKPKGRHSDGGGLYLVVDEAGKRRWVIFYTVDGKRREMGAGSVGSVPLSRAREIAAEVRQKVAGGVDPIARKAPTPLSEPARPTSFGDAALAYMADHESEWRSAVHRRQWRQTLEIHGARLWKKAVAEVETDDVVAVLRPLWQAKPETASRLRGRVERILDAARATGLRKGENPARWDGHLSLIFPAPKKLTRGHHAAMPYAEVPAFMAALVLRPANAAQALRLIVLTAARSGEVRGMVWGEVDLAAAVWTLPAGRMKGKREHRVPLSAPALALLKARHWPEAEASRLVFPNERQKPFSDVVFGALLKRMKVEGVTTHGFRSSFRDWAAEETDHPREVIEAALAHLVGDETERAYRRGDALAKRRVLMDHWATFLSTTGDPATKA